MSDALIEQLPVHHVSHGYLEVQRPAEQDETMREVVNALRGVEDPGSLRAAIHIGQVVFHHVFRGDSQVLHTRGRKCSAIKRLAAEPGLGMSPSSLWRAVATFELARRFPEIANYSYTGVGHVSVVLGLPLAEQFQLLRQTEIERWTRRRLQEVAQQLRSARRSASGFPGSSLVERLRGLEVLVAEAESPHQLGRVGDTEAQIALMLLGRIRERVTSVERHLAHRMHG